MGRLRWRGRSIGGGRDAGVGVDALDHAVQARHSGGEIGGDRVGEAATGSFVGHRFALPGGGPFLDVLEFAAGLFEADFGAAEGFLFENDGGGFGGRG